MSPQKKKVITRLDNFTSGEFYAKYIDNSYFYFGFGGYIQWCSRLFLNLCSGTTPSTGGTRDQIKVSQNSHIWIKCFLPFSISSVPRITALEAYDEHMVSWWHQSQQSSTGPPKNKGQCSCEVSTQYYANRHQANSELQMALMILSSVNGSELSKSSLLCSTWRKPDKGWSK